MSAGKPASEPTTSVRCKGCKRGDLPKWQMTCSKCKDMWHTLCASPQVATVSPSWECHRCAKPASTPTPEVLCEQCGLADHPEWQMTCSKCGDMWHSICTSPPVIEPIPRSWKCSRCVKSIKKKKKTKPVQAQFDYKSCVECRLSDEKDHLLVCHHCKMKWHNFCLSPMVDIPQTDWYCPKCSWHKPKTSQTKPPPPKAIETTDTKHTIANMTPPGPSCKVCGSNNLVIAQLTCHDCKSMWHTTCVPALFAQKHNGDIWRCEPCCKAQIEIDTVQSHLKAEEAQRAQLAKKMHELKQFLSTF